MMTEGHLLRFACVLTLLAYPRPSLFAQLCPHGGVDYAQLVTQMEHASDADVIYRAAAIGGERIMPTLRLLSAAHMEDGSTHGFGAAKTIPGATQVSLARLGDKDAIEQLEQEINRTKYPYDAVGKLVRVGTDQAISILMTYFVAHVHDDSQYIDLGDTGTDLRYILTSSLAANLHIGPRFENGTFMLNYADWLDWWKQSQGKRIALSISSGLLSPYSACLARKVEWGFPDAIFDMADAADPDLIPVLKTLERVGPQKLTLETKTTSAPNYSIHGRADVALAKLGDEQAFEAVVDGIDFGEYAASIQALTLIGGKHSAQALIDSFDDPHFMTDFRQRLPPETITDRENDRDEMIVSSLRGMVAHAPHFSGSLKEQKHKWQDWWAKNKDTTQFVKPPVKNYE
jgi:hypothetical protein